jgi:hypothetical protein
MSAKIHYSTAEIMQSTSLSRSRLHQIRMGYIDKKKDKIYSVEPYLIKGEDWDWQDGSIVYKESALKKILKRKTP